MSIVCANAIEEEYAVIGVDLPNKDNYWKIQSINEGHFPIISSDNKVQEYYDKSMEKGVLIKIIQKSLKKYIEYFSMKPNNNPIIKFVHYLTYF